MTATLHYIEGMTLTKILCPTDFSPGARQALRVAARMANETNAELVIAHDAFAVCDEVYEHLVFDGRRHVPLMTLANMRDRLPSAAASLTRVDADRPGQGEE